MPAASLTTALHDSTDIPTPGGWVPRAGLPSGRLTGISLRRPTRSGPGQLVAPAFSRNPVLAYLDQIGKIPLLDRLQELALAQQLDAARTSFRRRLLDNDFVLQAVADLLARVQAGKVRFDWAIQVSVRDRATIERLRSLLPIHLKQIEAALERNREDLRVVTGRWRSVGDRRAAWSRIVRRRRLAAGLVEELRVRLVGFEPYLGQLLHLCERLEQVRERIDVRAAMGNFTAPRGLRAEYQRIVRSTGQPPRRLRLVATRLSQDYARYTHARQAMSEANLRLVVSVARKYYPGDTDLLDRIQDGNVGLLRAVDNFDARRGFRFSTYATWWIRQAMSRSVVRGRDGRPPLRSLDDCVVDDGKQLSEVLADSRGEEQGEDDNQRFMHDRIIEALDSLGYREREILRLRFGLGDGFCYRQEDVGRIFGVTRERVRQLECRALSKLRHDSRVCKLA